METKEIKKELLIQDKKINVVYLKKSPEVMGVIKSTGLNTYINSLK